MAAVLGTMTLTGCVAAGAVGPIYLGSRAVPMGPELLQLEVRVRDAEDAATVSDYADCVAAGRALEAGFAFARHVRTTLSEEGGLWRGDAVYTLSPALPEGLRTIDAETKTAACREAGIPTV